MDIEDDTYAPSLAPSLATSPDSNVHRAGLATGDVVTLYSQSGQPLVVVSVDDEEGQPLWALASHHDAQEPSCLHVVQQVPALIALQHLRIVLVILSTTCRVPIMAFVPPVRIIAFLQSAGGAPIALSLHPPRSTAQSSGSFSNPTH